MEFQKIANFLDTTSDDKDLPRFVAKKWIEVYDQPEKDYNLNKEIRIKMSMLRSDLCNLVMRILLWKELLLLLIQMVEKEIKGRHLKIMHHLSTAFQKLMVYKLTMQKT